MILAKLKVSAFSPTSSPDRASGATYCSVPTKNPVRVSRSEDGSWASRAMPKSSSFAVRVEGLYTTFSGLRSRWIIPTAWAAPNPLANWVTMWETNDGANGPERRTNSDSGSPSTHSRAK